MRKLTWPTQLALLVMIWGFSFFFIKVGDQGLSPLLVVFGRMAFGAGTIWIVMAIRKERLPRQWRVWGQMAVIALLFNAAPYALFAYGELRVSSVLAGILNATTPLMVAPLAMLLLPDEPPTASRLSGLLIGFVGVLVVLGVWTGLGGGQAAGSLMCLGAALCYAIATILARRLLTGRQDGVIALATCQLICGTLEVAIFLPFFARLPTSLPVGPIASVLALGVLGTGIAFILQYAIIREAGAIMASMVTYLIPIVSTLAGVVLLGEVMTWNEPLGAVVVMGGVVISQGTMQRLRQRRLSGLP